MKVQVVLFGLAVMVFVGMGTDALDVHCDAMTAIPLSVNFGAQGEAGHSPDTEVVRHLPRAPGIVAVVTTVQPFAHVDCPARRRRVVLKLLDDLLLLLGQADPAVLARWFAPGKTLLHNECTIELMRTGHQCSPVVMKVVDKTHRSPTGVSMMRVARHLQPPETGTDSFRTSFTFQSCYAFVHLLQRHPHRVQPACLEDRRERSHRVRRQRQVPRTPGRPRALRGPVFRNSPGV